jgi:hypothetical protein
MVKAKDFYSLKLGEVYQKPERFPKALKIKHFNTATSGHAPMIQPKDVVFDQPPLFPTPR